MVFKKIKPSTNSLRNTIRLDYSFLWKGKSIKKYTINVYRNYGRNNSGKITSYKKSKGHKKKYRQLLSKKKYVLYGYVQTIEYDPFRSSFIFSFYQKKSGAEFYLLAPQTLKKNNLIYFGSKPISSKLTIGSYLPLKVVPIGSIIYNLEIIKNKGSQYVKSAGTFAKLLKKSILTNLGEVLLVSGEKRLIKLDCYVSLGSCSNPNKRFTTIGKAGRSRWLGIRPTTRGVAMNPVDHPHGGGNIHKVQKTPWGKYTKGPRTAKKKKKNPLILKDRRLKNK